MDLTFLFKRPKTHFRANGDIKANAPQEYLNKPDCDNLAKAVMDALTVLGFWPDDKFVCSMSIFKGYLANPTETPGVFIGIQEINPPARLSRH